MASVSIIKHTRPVEHGYLEGYSGHSYRETCNKMFFIE